MRNYILVGLTLFALIVVAIKPGSGPISLNQKTDLKCGYQNQKCPSIIDGFFSPRGRYVRAFVGTLLLAILCMCGIAVWWVFFGKK